MLSFVKIAKSGDAPRSYRGYAAIVAGTYSQLFHTHNIRDYSLWIVGPDGRVVNRVSWYPEEELSLAPNQNRDAAEQMVEDYNLGKL